jgi:hypothetical protein
MNIGKLTNGSLGIAGKIGSIMHLVLGGACIALYQIYPG